MAGKKAALKKTLVLVLGILYVLYNVTAQVYNALHYNVDLIYLVSTFVQFACMASSMVLITFRKKIPALVLTIAALALCLVNQFVIPYGEMDPLWKTLYYMLEYILLIVYILCGSDRNRNSLLWCGFFIVAVCLSVYEIAEVLSVRDLMLLVHYLSLYLVGYSPDKWYERKKAPKEPQA